MSSIHYKSQLDYLKNLRNETDDLILAMESFAIKNKIPILDWNSVELLENLIILYSPKRVLEIGTAIGYSTIRIVKHLKNKAIIDTIELSKDNIKLAKEFILKSKFNDKIRIFEGDALKIIPKIKYKYDFIFLDADKQYYVELFDLAIRKLKKGGVIFIDNLLWKGYLAVKKIPPKYQNSTKIIENFNKYFINHKSIKSNIFPIGDGIGIGIKR